MPTDSLQLIGAGGHAAVVADAAMLSGEGRLVVFSQDRYQAGHDVLGCVVQLLDEGIVLGRIHVAIGNNAVRSRLQRQFSGRGAVSTTIIHPQAIIAATSAAGAGSFVAAGAILAPRSRIGEGSIVNHRAIVDHDVSVGEFSHIAPGSVLGGGVKVGSGVLVGAGATVMPNVTIGNGATIGAGAVVLADVSAGATVVGVPGREIRKNA
ncbi:NeuD/PglB/VioB family sugar acetyltransferase [Devosia sp. BSSL-BM10]|uniref:NeuD/PglB/VioB family sugar acetyltransferase n=1 Tax=Devosia litorisediminis TaxID=2829817 RepID=A0A942I771_9HYPH|nr:NeuD/PglB/VioB family sugar acetyltransferase [Devosia litorisediminis]MBS3849803.1 NeuD/PglB/VioB family sugar acetyltransferase [Devosia litorisediminis]